MSDSPTPQDLEQDPAVVASQPVTEAVVVAQQHEMAMGELHVQHARATMPWRLGIVVVAVLSLGGVYVLLSNDKISDIEYARGLITVLFSVGVVAMALMVLLSLLLQRRDATDEESARSEKTFQRSKEILALLLGILGTIVGFYFGTPTGESNAALAIVEVVSSNDAPSPGAEVDLVVLIEGGQAPFKYSIAFQGISIEEVEGTTSDRWINESFSIPDNAGKTAQVTATVQITDDAGKKSVSIKTFTLTNSDEGP